MEEDYREKPHTADEIEQRPATEHSSSSDEDTAIPYNFQRQSTLMEETEIAELRQIATHVSNARRSTIIDDHNNNDDPFHRTYSSDSNNKPESPDFDPSRWARNFMREAEAEGIRPASTGIMFKDLSVSGTGDAVQLQQTVGSVMGGAFNPGEFLKLGRKTPKTILHKFDGLIRSGELLIVLGRPGSGCSTLLKTMCGELQGLNLDPNTTISYDGISQRRMKTEFKGEVIYNQEVDKHFPHLTVGQTLEFASAVRTPAQRTSGMSREEFSKMMTRVVMAICGLSHTYNTKVGNDFVRGVSGGERKRVSIAEMMLAGAPVSAWDNRYVILMHKQTSTYWFANSTTFTAHEA